MHWFSLGQRDSLNPPSSHKEINIRFVFAAAASVLLTVTASGGGVFRPSLIENNRTSDFLVLGPHSTYESSIVRMRLCG